MHLSLPRGCRVGSDRPAHPAPPVPAAAMDTCEAVRFYVDKMLDTGENNGMKVLLFDEETLRIMGLVCVVSEVPKTICTVASARRPRHALPRFG